MPTSSVAVRRLALAMLGLSAVSASALGQNASPADSRQAPAKPVAVLPEPPPGPIESRIIAVPVRSANGVAASAPQAPSGAGSAVITVVDRRTRSRQPTAAAEATRSDPLMVTVTPMPFRSAEPDAAATPPPAALAALAPDLGPAAPPPTQAPLVASVPFIGPSANLTDLTRAQLDSVGADLAKKRPRLIEIRAFATGDDIVSRKIALARALVVRSYLIDRGVKSRMVVGAYPGDGERVDIMVPNT